MGPLISSNQERVVQDYICVWSADYPRAMRVARRIRAGTVWIWDNYAQPVEGITDGTGLAMKPPYAQVIKD